MGSKFNNVQGSHLLGCFIVRQPNGLFCRFDLKNNLTHFNMTEQELIVACTKELEEDIHSFIGGISGQDV